MSAAARALCALLADERGATLAEYALVLALLSAGAITALMAFGGQTTQMLDGTSSALTQSGETPPGGP